MPKILSDKVALITGGSRGIGAAIVRRLASDGASVAFTYGVSEDRAKMLAAEVEAVGGKVLPVKADSADAEAVKRAVAQTINSLGRLDILSTMREFSLAAGSTTTASRTSTGWSR
jgi:3-oxoacyl-[acyl-carrier protein] reductase